MLYDYYRREHALRPAREDRFRPDQTETIEIIGSPVVSVASVKSWLQVHHSEEDDAIEDFIAGVTGQIEAHIKQDVVKKKRRSWWHQIPDDEAHLPRGPHTITKVEVEDHDGEAKELTEENGYWVKGIKYKILHRIYKAGQLYVEYEAGYDPDNVPNQVPAAIRQELSLQFKNRSDPDTPGMTSYKGLSLESRHLLSPIMRRAL